MLVYGDHDRTVATCSHVATLYRDAARLGEQPAGLAWHAACVSLFIGLAALLQGQADRESALRGYDDASGAQDAIGAALKAAAQAVDGSWSSGFARQAAPDLAALAALKGLPLAPALSVRRCEGYAYYALYPELYLAAARELPPTALVIGLRSIGTGLAALVAAVCGAPAVTVRPVGEPFARAVNAGPVLSAAVAALEDGAVVLVDEGPGLSGSSLGGAADWLEGLGIERSRIVFMPGHANDLGPHASAAHRARWNGGRRLAASFEEVIVGGAGGVPLAGWFADSTGEALEPLWDLSGSAWRRLSPWPDPPADGGREARKFLLSAERGRFLLKFIGLDDDGQAKFDRAVRLHEAGFAPEPLAWRYGFIAERWVQGDALDAAADMEPALARYLSFRASAFADAPPGASLRELVDMARHNIAEASGRSVEPLFAPWPAGRVTHLQAQVRPVHVDGRLHRWEWLQSAAGAIKTDAVDHSQAHDLVGCQDIAWDVAGAAVEFDLPAAERDRLIAAVMGERSCAAELVDLLTLCYLGFQIGWWTMAQDSPANRRQLHVYLNKLAQIEQP